jgi:hypothetical protein
MSLRNVFTHLQIHTALQPKRPTSTLIIQGDRNVTQLILKYLLMVEIEYNSIVLTNTQYRCDYTRAHVGHFML